MTRLEEVQYLRTEPDGRHYNCAQSLLVPFASEVGLTKEQADALGANFGAGMKMGATCGVLTSALMLLGMKGCTPQQAAQLVQRFREKHQDTDCAALLSKAKEAGIPGRSTATVWCWRWLRSWTRSFLPRSRDGSGGSAAGSQTPKSPPARSSVVHRRRNKVKSYHFRGHTPGWLLLAFGQFTFCDSEMILLTKFLPTIIGTPENHFMVFWERRSSGGNEHSGLHGCE